MNSPTVCFSSEQIESLLKGDCLPAEVAEAEEHLAECPACRSSMESVIGDYRWWDDARQSLSARASHLDGTTGHFVSEEREAEPPQISQLIELLGPTDDPTKLGRIGAYEVVGVLGRGGMGVVFKALDPALNRFVAIKLLLPHLAASGSARKRFAREAQAAAAVVDDHVMAIHGVSEWNSVPYFVMPYARGVSLQKRLNQDGPLEIREILRVGMQAAKGLAAAHAQGLVHRDVKPANIFLDEGVERVQLMDFGLARAVDDASLTRSGTLAGTPQYMSPEQARAETIDHRSDLFSLGSVMYAMCTGHAPFRAESSYSVLRLITDKEPRPIRDTNPDIPEWLCTIIGQLMAKRPEDRYSSAGEVVSLLEQSLAHVQQPSVHALPQELQQVTSKGSRDRRPPNLKFLAASAGALMALLFGVIIVLQWSKGTITIESEADGVPIRITQGDKVVEKLIVTRTGKTVRMAAGVYEVEIEDGGDHISINDGTVTLKRGDKAIVHITSRDSNQPKQTKWSDFIEVRVGIVNGFGDCPKFTAQDEIALNVSVTNIRDDELRFGFEPTDACQSSTLCIRDSSGNEVLPNRTDRTFRQIVPSALSTVLRTIEAKQTLVLDELPTGMATSPTENRTLSRFTRFCVVGDRTSSNDFPHCYHLPPGKYTVSVRLKIYVSSLARMDFESQPIAFAVHDAADSDVSVSQENSMFRNTTDLLHSRTQKKRELQKSEGATEAGRDKELLTSGAVDAGLKWIVNQQNADGSWMNLRADQTRPLDNDRKLHDSVDATALCLLALVGDGNTHLTGTHARTVQMGLSWLLQQQQADGRFPGFTLKTHALCLNVLGELYAMTRDEKLKTPLQKAVKVAVDSQNKAGGWPYVEEFDFTDAVVASWFTQGLHAAHQSGQKVNHATLVRTKKYCSELIGTSGVRFYPVLGNSSPDALSAAHMLATLSRFDAERTELDPRQLSSQIEKLIQSHPFDSSRYEYEYWFALTQAAHAANGSTWESWNRAVLPGLCRLQNTQGDLAGSWPHNGKYPQNLGPLHNTCMAVLTLEVDYRWCFEKANNASASNSTVESNVVKTFNSNGTTLLDAVADFNRRMETEHPKHGQPPLTDDEVITAVRSMSTELDAIKVSELEYQALRKAIEEGFLPDNWTIASSNSFKLRDGRVGERWSVQLKLQRDDSSEREFVFRNRYVSLKPDEAQEVKATPADYVPLSIWLAKVNETDANIYVPLPDSPVTEQEIIAALTHLIDKEQSAEFAPQRKTLQEIIGTRSLPKQAKLTLHRPQRLEGYSESRWAMSGGFANQHWELRLEYPYTVGNKLIVTAAILGFRPIRYRIVSSVSDEEIYWGPQAEDGMQFGIALEDVSLPDQSPSLSGASISYRPHFYFRNPVKAETSVQFQDLYQHYDIIANTATGEQLPTKRRQGSYWISRLLFPDTLNSKSRIYKRACPFVLGNFSPAFFEDSVSLEPPDGRFFETYPSVAVNAPYETPLRVRISVPHPTLPNSPNLISGEARLPSLARREVLESRQGDNNDSPAGQTKTDGANPPAAQPTKNSSREQKELPEESKPLLDRLQGTWRTSHSGPMIVWEVRGDRVHRTSVFDGRLSKTEEHQIRSLDDTVNPARIELVRKDQETGKFAAFQGFKYLLALEGDVLTVCQHSGADYPSEIAKRPGLFVSEFRRDQDTPSELLGEWIVDDWDRGSGDDPVLKSTDITFPRYALRIHADRIWLRAPNDKYFVGPNNSPEIGFGAVREFSWNLPRECQLGEFLLTTQSDGMSYLLYGRYQLMATPPNKTKQSRLRLTISSKPLTADSPSPGVDWHFECHRARNEQESEVKLGPLTEGQAIASAERKLDRNNPRSVADVFLYRALHLKSKDAAELCDGELIQVRGLDNSDAVESVFYPFRSIRRLSLKAIYFDSEDQPNSALLFTQSEKLPAWDRPVCMALRLSRLKSGWAMTHFESVDEELERKSLDAFLHDHPDHIGLALWEDDDTNPDSEWSEYWRSTDDSKDAPQ